MIGHTVVTTVVDNAEGGGTKTHTYEYDPSLRPTRITNDRGVVEYTWLPGDLLGGYRVDGGAWVNYTYYSSRDMWTIQRQGDANPFSYTYLLSGARNSLSYSNGSQVQYTSDNLDRLLTLTNLDPVGGLISRYTYQYDRDLTTDQFTRKGLRVSMFEDLAAGPTGLEKYYFDTLYQLNRADYPDGEHDEWTYDRIGNRMSASKYVPGQDPVIHNYAYIPNGHGGNSQRLQSDGVNSYTWDDNGNMYTKSSPGGISYYTWNSRNMLTAITGPGLEASYRYDFVGRRSGRTVNSVQAVFGYSGWDLTRQTGDGQTREYVFGEEVDEIRSMRIGAEEYLYYSDDLASVRQITDSGGAVRNQYSYSPWGELQTATGDVPNSFMFTGRESEGDDLMSFRFRHYSPEVGRFLSEDPIRLVGGDLGFYRYAYNDPVSLTDPMGLSCKSFAEKWWENVKVANEVIPGAVAPPLLSALTAGKWAQLIGTITARQWIGMGLRGAVMEGVAYSGVETGVLVGLTTLTNWALVAAAYEIGVGIGSAINVLALDIIDPDVDCDCP